MKKEKEPKGEKSEKGSTTFKVGMRVVVKEGVSACLDEGSLLHSEFLARRSGLKPDSQGFKAVAEAGESREHFVGLKGEIVKVGKDGPCLKGHEEVTCPDGYEEAYLVDNAIANGKPCSTDGFPHMREWFYADEIEPG
jgi:hypothetical protein